jgi:hypothetical protein
MRRTGQNRCRSPHERDGRMRGELPSKAPVGRRLGQGRPCREPQPTRGNLTEVTVFTTAAMWSKRLELLRDLKTAKALGLRRSSAGMMRRATRAPVLPRRCSRPPTGPNVRVKSAVGALLRHVRLAAVSGLHVGVAIGRICANRRHCCRNAAVLAGSKNSSHQETGAALQFRVS